ncbi:MAG: response regulator [bacterium]
MPKKNGGPKVPAARASSGEPLVPAPSEGTVNKASGSQNGAVPEGREAPVVRGTPEAAPRRVLADGAPSGGTAVPGAPRRVLIVEDSKDLTGILENLLSAKGIKVTTAGDGVAGIEAARREKPDLILLDILLPKLSGFEVARMLKEDNSTRRIPILVVSTLGKPDDLEKIRSCGINNFMKKPYRLEDLLNEINRLLSGK